MMAGLNRPGLEGVLLGAAVFTVKGSMVEKQHGESRHVWRARTREMLRLRSM
jgi:hypothetical protein